MRQAPLPKRAKRRVASPAHSGHALPAPATQAERFKPAHARPPAKHSSAPAHWTPEQKRRALALLREYEAPKPGSAVRALDRLGHAYEHNPVARNPIVGRKGLLGGVEDLVKSTDPISLGQALASNRHPIRSWQKNQAASRAAVARLKRGEISQSEAIKESGVSYGIMAGGPGGGFRGTAGHEPFKPPSTRAEAEAKPKLEPAKAKPAPKPKPAAHEATPPEQLERLVKDQRMLAARIRRSVAELDARKAPDSEYSGLLATASKKSLGKGETRRSRALHFADLYDRKAAQFGRELATHREAVSTPAETLGPDPPGTLYHGSPEGDIGELDPLHHTRAWREGIGFYLTEDVKKAEGYARGRTARGDRRATAATRGKVSGFRLKPGTKVLDMGQPADLSLWRSIAKDHGFSEADFDHYIVRQSGERPTNNRIRGELLAQLHDTLGSDAPYALEEAIVQRGYQATTHLEGQHRVWVIKHKDAVERVATQSERVAEAMAARKRAPESAKVEAPTGAAPRSLALPGHLKPPAAPPVRPGSGAGGGGGRPPFQPPLSDFPREPGAPPAQEVVAKSLGSARRLAAEQKKMYREERSQRVARGQAAMEAAGGGRAGYEAAMREQRGELQKTTFNRLREGNLSSADVETLIRQAQDHPELKFWQKQNVTKALLDAFEHGRTPRPHEIKLLQTVFGQDAAEAISHASLLKRSGRLAVDVAGIPRSLMASVDLSAPFRQGLVAGSRHPAIFFRNFKHMVKALGSERAYQGILDDIHSRPNAQLYEEAGVKFTELGHDLGQREEAFPGAMAERIPIAGRVVHASGRAYTGFLDKMRADMFDRQLELARKAGVNVEDRAQLRGIARLVNSATGRGELGPVESWAPALNTIFFSPRLIASRVNLLNPVWYATMPRYARHQALRSMVQLGGSAGLLLGASSYFGAKVGTDPRSADFAKLRIGNTRADVLGGFQQYVRLGSQMATGKVISSTTGKTMTLGSGFADLSRKDILERFVSGKFSPPVSFVNDFFKGTDFADQPFSVKREVLARVVPLVVQDSYDLYKNTDSIPAALLGYSISAFGIGMQTYGPRDVAKQEAEKSDKAAKEQDVHLHNLVRTGVLPRSQFKEYRHALDLYNERNALNTQIEHAVPDDHPRTREIRKTLGLIALLEQHGLMSPQKAKEYRHAYHASTERTIKELRSDRAAFWDETVGPLVTWYHDKAGHGVD